MQTIGHHTCKKDGGIEFVMQEGPFLSEYYVPQSDEDPKEPHYPFLGSGYYFWDNNLDTAIWWGGMYYTEGFYVIESALTMDAGIFLDLVGNRSSMIWLKDRLEELLELGYERAEWSVGQVIEMLKEIKLKSSNEEAFPYSVIRAVDYRAKGLSNFVVNFASNRPNFTLLDPRMIICIVEKNSSILQNLEIIYESN